MKPDWENECVSKSALIEWLRPYLHTGEPIPADVLISDIQMMPPTLTPQNEWVSVEEELPSDDDDGLEYFCMTNATGKGGGVLSLEWEVATIRGKTVRRWRWLNRISPWTVTHWMKRPVPPDKDNNVPAKAQNEPLTIEELRKMEGHPVYIISKAHAISEWNIPKGVGEIVIAYDVPCAGMKEVTPSVKFIDGKELSVEKYGSDWVAYRRPPEVEEDA